MKKPAQYILIVLSISALLLLLSKTTIFREGIDNTNPQKGFPPGFSGIPGPMPGRPSPAGGAATAAARNAAVAGGTVGGAVGGANNTARNPNQLGEDCVASETCKTFVSKSISSPANINSTSGANSDVDTSYSYVNFIKTPSEMKISDKGTIETLQKDVEGLAAYAKLLIEGSSDASKAPNKGPLGNKFFVKTMGKCNDINTMDPTKKEKDRYLYINNVPLGNIPMLSSGTDTNYKDFRGLIPGMMMNMDVLNPGNIAAAFSTSGTPDCQQITMQTINSKNVISSETNYVTISDISNLDACLFTPDKQKKTN